ncbi:histidine phosphatase family protein [Roseibacillus persicicus]|uniref:SixA phosphatase family protein n=1 Tax=Roseibacillus persicicus TaxID=454148 RepID=UPI00398BA520
MEVILVRHGKAHEVIPGERDHDRSLTDKGWKQSRAVGKLLKKMDLIPDLVFTSPRVRALETAEGVVTASGAEGEPVVQDWLDFDLRPANVVAELGALPDEITRVVLVGHEPTFSGMVSWLLGAETGYCEVKKAALVHFSMAPPTRHGVVLKMLVPPKVLI